MTKGKIINAEINSIFTFLFANLKMYPATKPATVVFTKQVTIVPNGL